MIPVDDGQIAWNSLRDWLDYWMGWKIWHLVNKKGREKSRP
jgi:hypothetical protein